MTFMASSEQITFDFDRSGDPIHPGWIDGTLRARLSKRVTLRFPITLTRVDVENLIRIATKDEDVFEGTLPVHMWGQWFLHVDCAETHMGTIHTSLGEGTIFLSEEEKGQLVKLLLDNVTPGPADYDGKEEQRFVEAFEELFESGS